MLGIGIIGYGYWGPNLVRNFSEIGGSRVFTVCDLSSKRLALAKSRYPNIDTTTNYKDILKDNRIDAVVLATPVSTHFGLAMEVLRAGKHVLVEKPISETTEQACQLIAEADRRQLVLMVDYTFVYTGAVRKIHDLVFGHELGEIYYYDSVRVNLGLFQHDVSVLWDLAVHDLSILDYVLPSRPTAVSAIGISHISGQPENIAYLALFFDNHTIAHIHTNWLAPVKVRRILLGGSRKMIYYDDLEPSEKIKIYDCGVTLEDRLDSIHEMLVSYRTGDILIPKLDSTEALRRMAEEFIGSIEQSKDPITGGEAGLRVVRILEASARSMANGGIPIELT